MSHSDTENKTEAMRQGRMQWKPYLLGLLTAALKLALVIAAAGLIWVKLTPYFRIDRNKDGDQMRAFPKDTIDVVALGSSHIQYAFNPGVFYAETGYYGYVFGSVCQPFSESVYLLEELLKSQHPETVIVDVFTLLPQSQVCYADGTYYIAMDMMSGQTRLSSVDAIPSTVDIDTRRAYAVDLLMNHDNWKRMDFSDIDAIIKNASPDQGIAWGLGYVDQMPEDPKYTPLEVFEPSKDLTLSSRECYWIDRLITMCRENDIHLLFVKTPYQEDQADADKLAAVWKYLDEAGADYVDFLAKAQELDWYLDMDGDTWHNNTWGAEIVTNYLAHMIQDKGWVSSHTDNPEVDAVYRASMKRTSEYLLSKQNINIYRLLEEAAVYPCTILFRSKGYETSSIGTYENEALNRLGLSHDFIHDKESDYYAAVKDGVLLEDGNEPFEIDIDGTMITFTENDILFNGASTGTSGELQIMFCGDGFEWLNPIPIDYASGHFWKKGCDGWNCTAAP